MTTAAKSPKPKATPAMRFIGWVGALTLLLVLLAVIYQLFQPQIERFAMRPRGSFAASPVDAQADYTAISSTTWVARPGLSPNLAQDAPLDFLAAPKPPVDVFVIGPTTYYSNQRWNAPLADAETNQGLDAIARVMATAFNNVGAIYMPRIRQATFGVTYASAAPDAQAALDLAYTDVLAAFDVFQKSRGVGTGPQRPFILAAADQGAIHALRLLKDRLAAPVQQRLMVAAYITGYPVSVEADLAPLGLRACETPQAINCVMAWQSFGASGARTDDVQKRFAASVSFNGVPRSATHILCTNPITGWINGKDGPRAANLGALAFPARDKPLATLKANVTGASCNADGFLLLSPSPGAPFEDRKMGGENYTAFDFALFWANIRANAEARVSAFYTPR
jgi:Protein of unknown function (DUF3089)